jgi:amino acid adenylation domain-containing protein
MRDLGRREGATLFMTLLAAFQTLLSRFSGQNDIAVGSPIAGRRHPETESLVGFFVNSLVLRTDLSGNPTFRELLARVRTTALEAYEHQDMPFEKLVEELHPDRNLGRTPLFQAMFAHQNVPRNPLEFRGLMARRVEITSTTAKFDLSLDTFEETDGLKTLWEYSTDLFDHGTIERMMGHFQTLLEGIVANPDQRLSDLPLLSEQQTHQLLVQWNDSQKDLSKDKCVHELIEAQAEKTPDAVALACPSTGQGEEQQLSYRELNSRANQLAHYLGKLGVGPEVLVGLYMERSPEMIIAILAVHKAGGAYVPLDPNYPLQRLLVISEETQFPVILSQQRLAESFPGHMAKVICLDTEWATIAQESQENPHAKATPENLAYVIYTSGSTGRPKGVEITHRSLTNFVCWAASAYELTPSDRVLQFASISFDTAAEEIFPCLASGAELVLRTDSMLDSLSGFLKSCGDLQITVLDLPTAYWHELVDEISSTPPTELGNLRLVIIGGEQASANHLAKWREVIGDRVRLVNTYGPTEATVVTTLWDASRALKPDRSSVEVTIGRPIANTQVYILDGHLNPVPIGVAGEIHIGGVGVARGYLKSPELTAKKFIPHPFSPDSEARLYKTGDLARYRPDGNVEFIGRTDNQIKIRGFRVELGEIEAALALHPSVRRTVVLARKDAAGYQQLVAYVETHKVAVPTSRELASFIRAMLPDYMVPSVFVLLDALPLTSNGKLDLRALPAPNHRRRDFDDPFEEPRTPFEELLTQIWSEVLHLDDIGIYDNFFDLGGHSLLATRIISRIRDVFHCEVPLRALFEAPTISKLVERLEAVNRPELGTKAVRISAIARDRQLPLSYAQQRLWFLDQLVPNSPVYNVPSTWRLTGHLNLSALERSITEIVQRHEALRTIFISSNGKPMQQIMPSSSVSISVVDLSNIPDSYREQKALSYATAEGQRPFDLTSGPLLRASLIRLGPDDQLLNLTMHHIVSDGWSVEVMLRELAVHYAAFAQGQVPCLEKPPVQYADYAHWQRQWLQGEVLEKQLLYWRNQLHDVPVLELPADRPRPAVRSYRGGSQTIMLSNKLSLDLKQLSRQQGVTLYMTLLAAFDVVLHRYTGQNDIAVGSPIAGRTRSEVENLIGLFVNTLVLRTDLSGDPTFLELLCRIRETTLAAYTHQDLSFEKLVEELRPERSLSQSPLFQVMFSLEHAPTEGFRLGNLTVTPVDSQCQNVKFDLNLVVRDTAQGLRLLLNYSTELFDDTTIVRMIEHFQILLKSIAADPPQRIAALPMLSEAERHQLLVEWNGTKREYAEDKCVHEIFETQVEKTPDALAVVSEDGQLTYRELNRKANQLARYLRKRGVGRDFTVGICMNLSVDLIVGLLGTLKAGGAYVPLDPEYPKDRLEFILADARADILLTQQEFSNLLPKYTGKKLALDKDWGEISLESEENLSHQVAANDLAYVIFTSGSTGKPKGVMIEHTGLTNYLNHCVSAYPMQAGRGSLVHSSIAFDATITGLFAPLLVGRATYLVPRTDNLEALATMLLRLGDFSVVKITPAHLALLSRQISPQNAQDLARCFVIGGENLTADQIAYWQKNAPNTLLFNEYGPTETVVGCIVYEARKWRGTGSVPIGRAIPNTTAYVLDQRMQPVPIGVPGELYIGGGGVARGYLNRDDLTREKFIADPFSAEPGARLYRTGDVAHYISDGNIVFDGRIDNQVKLRGYRIELGEIESVFCQHPAIGAAAVLARGDNPEDRRLVGYFVSNHSPCPTSSELRNFLSGQLPDYMVPSAFICLDALPLTFNGKIDTKALPPPEGTMSDSKAVYIAPRDDLERHLITIWESVLGIRPIGVKDNFFHLGGHSLLAVKVFFEIEKFTHRKLPLSILFQAPTVEQLAVIVRREVDGSIYSSLVPIQPNGSKTPLFLVHGADGGVLNFVDLARHMDEDQPLYGLESPGRLGESEPLTEIASIASHYVDEIRKVQPKGPYLLVGYCIGGTVAYEMSKQLAAQGQNIALLALMDSPPPVRNHSLRDTMHRARRALNNRIIHRYSHHVRNLRNLGYPEWPAYVLEKLNVAKAQIFASMFPDKSSTETDVRPAHRAGVMVANISATRNYEPEPYPGRITLFLTQDSTLNPPNDQRLAWSELAEGGVELHTIPGDHSNMLWGPHARGLAAKLTACIENAKNQN